MNAQDESTATLDGDKAVAQRWIHEGRLGQLREKIAKFAKRAAKLGQESVQLDELGERFMNQYRDKFGNKYGVPVGTPARDPMDKPLGTYRQVLVRATGALPRLNGWKILAGIDHDDDGNVVNVAPGQTLPTHYRTAAPACDHCKTKRARATTTVVQHTDGQVMQIGHNCLADFLRTGDADKLAEMAEWQSDFFTEFGSDGDGDGFGGGSAEPYHETEGYLQHVAASVALYGYVSRAKSEEWGKPSTRTDAMDHFAPTRNMLAHGFKPRTPTEVDIAQAQAAREWAAALTDVDTQASDFLYNVRQFARKQAFRNKHAGYVAAILPAYLKAMEPREPADTRPSEYQGTVGKRQVFTGLKLMAVIRVEGIYGVTKIHKFRDGEGNVFTWFSTGAELDPGLTYDLKATVKAHGVYDDVKQTVITRAVAIEPVAAAA